MNINERTSVPIVWFVAAVGVAFSIGSAGSIWVFSINEGVNEMKARLARIESKLGITEPIVNQKSFAGPLWAGK